MNDLQIARAAEMQPISTIAKKLDIKPEELEQYGRFKAKLPLHTGQKRKGGKLILVSAITPTPAGEGKTTCSIGLTDGLNHIGKNAVAVLREPSLGPVFGMKGGATGGGHAQVLPMEDINLHFTGDFSAIEKANNLLAALVDNYIHHRKGKLEIDPRTVVWKRVMDVNDRSLRQLVSGLGGTANGTPREAGFNITAASEIMAILCLAVNLNDLKSKLGDIFIGYTFQKKPVYARDINAQGAMAALLKDAIKPNLVQTLEGNPVIIHGGPFANIAQGTNSIIATKMGLNLADYAVTEAGFGFDLGGEKFMNIKCRAAGLAPELVVMVATVRALKYHGGVALADLDKENAAAVKKGLVNLEKHLENVKHFGLPAVVAINKFSSDSAKEISEITSFCEALNIPVSISDAWARGGEGAADLAETVIETIKEGQNDFKMLYSLNEPIEKKIETIATRIYGADKVEFSATAQRDLRRIKNLGQENLPICMAKTQSSFSDDPKKIGRPQGFALQIREIELATGAGFIIPITGNMMRMPGLPAEPAANNIDIDEKGNITGLF